MGHETFSFLMSYPAVSLQTAWPCLGLAMEQYIYY